MNLDIALVALSDLKVKLGAKHAKQISELGSRVDSINISMRESFRAAYVVYYNDPCTAHGWFANEVSIITSREQMTRKLALIFDHCSQMLSSGSNPDDVVSAVWDQVNRLESEKAPLPRVTEQRLDANLDAWEKSTR